MSYHPDVWKELKRPARSLVDIRDASKPSPCATCASDATLDITWKEKVWVQGFDKKMHDLQVHDPFPRANRFLRACIQNGEVCTFRKVVADCLQT